MTELSGVSEEEQTEAMRKQRISDENARLIKQGYVPVAVDFGVIAGRCGVEIERHSVDLEHWVPAWYLAAWRAYKDRHGNTDALGAPTPHFLGFIGQLKNNEREQLLLVSELLLSYPHQSDLTAQGIRSWIDQHG